MLDRLSTTPTLALELESHRLEGRLIEGRASQPEIDRFVAVSGELGRRIAMQGSRNHPLDAILDPRD